MMKPEFWDELRKSFKELAEEEYSAVAEPGDSRRLRVYADYTRAGHRDLGHWRVSDGFSADFQLRFQQLATRAGLALDPPPNANAFHFWLHKLYQQVLEFEARREDRTYLAAGDQQHGVMRDPCAASATLCTKLGLEAVHGTGGSGFKNSHIVMAAKAQKWEDIMIRVLSDTRVQVFIGGRPGESLNFADLGLEDRRGKGGKPNKAWSLLLKLALNDGIIPREEILGHSEVHNAAYQLRQRLRDVFRLDGDPLPFEDGTGYRTRFRIKQSPAVER